MASFRFRGQLIALLTAMPAWLAIHTAFSSRLSLLVCGKAAADVMFAELNRFRISNEAN